MPNLNSTQTLSLVVATTLYDLLILCAWERRIKKIKKKLQRAKPIIFLAFPTKGAASSSLVIIVTTRYDPLILCLCSTLPLHDHPSLSLSLSFSFSFSFSFYLFLSLLLQTSNNCIFFFINKTSLSPTLLPPTTSGNPTILTCSSFPIFTAGTMSNLTQSCTSGNPNLLMH